MGLSLLLERDTVVRTFGELFWFLRRKGFSFSISKVIDAYRALALIGLGDKGQVQEALALTLLSTREERERFDAVFGAYFERACRSQTVSGCFRRRTPVASPLWCR